MTKLRKYHELSYLCARQVVANIRPCATGMRRIEVFLKDWMLPISMTTGALAYIIYTRIPALRPMGPMLADTISWLQPALVFAMLFLSFCKVAPRDLRPHRWQAWLLAAQLLLFGIVTAALSLVPGMGIGSGVSSALGEGVVSSMGIGSGVSSALGYDVRVLIESAILCIIMPTATASAVVTGKLNGSIAGIVTYTVLINIAVAIVVPAVFPLIHPMEGLTFWEAFWRIIHKVFPTLIFPCLAAWAVRYLTPGLHRWLLKFKDLSFYIWAFSLALAIAMTTRSIMHSNCSVWVLLGIAGVSLLCCAVQFFVGKAVGSRYHDRITPGQALGQKNTVFGIWMGYAFLTPVVAVAAGCYAIWQNLFNSWELYEKRHEED